MSESLAERALAAHTAQTEEARLQKEAREVRVKGVAADAILLAADRFGITLTADSLERSYSSWLATFQVEEDVSLIFTKGDSSNQVEVRVKPAEQLYWDLPPGEEKKTPGGGAYGGYGLSSITEHLQSLSDLGAAITKIRTARELWRAKHCTD